MKHNNGSAFIAYCTVGNCMYSTRSWNAYKLHFRKKHPILNMDNESNATLQYDNTERDSDVLDNNEENNANINYQDILANRGNLNASHKKSYLMLLAKFFLSLKTEHKVNKSSIDKIAVSSRHLMLNILATTLEKIEKILLNYG